MKRMRGLEKRRTLFQEATIEGDLWEHTKKYEKDALLLQCVVWNVPSTKREGEEEEEEEEKTREGD